MTINYYNDLNVYFHMKNHYKKLRKVKSTVDNRISQVFLKQISSGHSEKCLTLPDDERHSKNCSHIPNHSSKIKKHNCLSADTRSDTSLSSYSRPPSRRNPRELVPQNSASRSSSTGPSLRKFTISNRQNSSRKNQIKKTHSANDKEEKNENLLVAGKKCSLENNLKQSVNNANNSEKNEIQQENSNRSSNSASQASEDTSRRKKHSATEHEYLQFLLRITEDIIMNNYLTKKDINKVLENHIEANKQRLELPKMKAHASRLCRELNIEYDTSELDLIDESSNNLYLYSPNLKAKFTDCECANTRYLEFGQTVSLECHEMEDIPVNYSYLMAGQSLGRVTECTEPTESINTLVNDYRMPSNVTMTSYDIELHLPGLESENEQVMVVEKQDESLSEKEIIQAFCKPKFPTPKIPLLELVTPKTSSTNIIHDRYIESIEALNLTSLESYTDDFDTNRTLTTSSDTAKDDTVIEEALKNISMSSMKINEKSRENTPKSSPKKVTCENVIEPNEVSEKKCSETLPHNSQEVLSIPVSNFKDTFLKKSNNLIKVCEDTKNNTPKNPVVKLIVDGDIKNEDYVLVNGPIYIFKALMDTNPQLIQIKEEIPKKVDRETSVSPSLETKPRNEFPLRLSNNSEVTLHSLKEKLNETFKFDLNFYKNSRLITTDYDLTPEREKDATKYHYLMVDASTSVSTVNLSNNNDKLSNNLLLNDTYVLEKDEKFKMNFKNVNELDNYAKMRREFPEHDYIKEKGGLGEMSQEIINDAIESEISSMIAEDGDPSKKIYQELKKTAQVAEFVSPESSLSFRSEGEASSKN